MSNIPYSIFLAAAKTQYFDKDTAAIILFVSIAAGVAFLIAVIFCLYLLYKYFFTQQ
jgi:hypothetical protein